MSLVDMQGSSAARTHLGQHLTFSVVDQLGIAIASGMLDACSKSTELQLSSRYGVSRSVTREAVKMLASKGMLRTKPRLGISIQPASSWNLFDPDVLRWVLTCRTDRTLLIHMAQLRFAIEPEAAFRAAASENEYARRRVADAAEQVSRSTRDECVASVTAFHVAVLIASGNRLFAQFDQIVRGSVHASAARSRCFSAESLWTDAHAAAAQAIAEQDAYGARARMRQALQVALTSLARADVPEPETAGSR